MLGETAAQVFDFDMPTLRVIADEVGPDLNELLAPPPTNLFPRGDVNKPVLFV
jgi:hypothetical protein